MNYYKKQEVSMYISLGIGMLLIGILSGDIKGFLALLLTFISVTGGFYAIYKGILYTLNKVFPESNTITKGASLTITKNVNYNNK
jgi:hypothetical protein